MGLADGTAALHALGMSRMQGHDLPGGMAHVCAGLIEEGGAPRPWQRCRVHGGM